jgi:hypothetical protein
MGTGHSFVPEVKLSRREAGHSPSSGDVKNKWSYTYSRNLKAAARKSEVTEEFSEAMVQKWVKAS